MLKGKVAVITGAAQGIGKHAAKTLAQEGARVVIADVNDANARTTADELGKISETLALQVDVRHENEVKGMFAKVAEKFGGIDVLVNNAAIVPHFMWGLERWPHISQMPMEFWDRVIRTNLYGTFLGTKHVIPYMEKRKSGHIINLYGGSSPTPPGGLAYSITKDAIRTFTRYNAEEVRASNICVVTFSPRLPIATEPASEEAKKRLPGPEVLANAFVLAAQLPMERSGQCVALEDGKLVIEVPMEG